MSYLFWTYLLFYITFIVNCRQKISIIKFQDREGSAGTSPNNPTVTAIRAIKKRFGDSLLIACDVCLCPYTSDGHCGIIDEVFTLAFIYSEIRFLGSSIITNKIFSPEWSFYNTIQPGSDALIKSVPSSSL